VGETATVPSFPRRHPEEVCPAGNTLGVQSGNPTMSSWIPGQARNDESETTSACGQYFCTSRSHAVFMAIATASICWHRSGPNIMAKHRGHSKSEPVSNATGNTRNGHREVVPRNRTVG